jgi:hypothetical protein
VRNETDKAKVEIAVFYDFVNAANIDIHENTVRKGEADLGQPDIFCEMEEGGVYFELTEACAPEFAAAITRSLKSEKPEAVWGADVSKETIRNKLKKNYSVSVPIELILYTAGKTALSDDVIAAKLEPVLSNGMGPFRRVWLYGNGVQVLASNS